MFYDSPAMRELQDQLKKRLEAGDGAYDSRHVSSCEMYMRLLSHQVTSSAVQMDVQQAYQVADCIVVRIDAVLRRQAEVFTAMETFQIATFINTCQRHIH